MEKKWKINNKELIRYSDYNCCYKVKGNINLNNQKGSACYSSFFSSLHREKKFKGQFILYVSNDPTQKRFKRLDNCCYLTLEEITDFMDFISNLLIFTYELENTDSEYIITTNLDHTEYQCKVISTIMRWLFEDPFTVSLKEAYNLKKSNIEEFKDKNIIELMLIVSNVLDIWGYGHSVFQPYNYNYILYIDSLENTFKDYFNDKFKGSIDHLIGTKKFDVNTFGRLNRVKYHDDLTHYENLINGILEEKYIEKYKKIVEINNSFK